MKNSSRIFEKEIDFGQGWIQYLDENSRSPSRV